MGEGQRLGAAFLMGVPRGVSAKELYVECEKGRRKVTDIRKRNAYHGQRREWQRPSTGRCQSLREGQGEPCGTGAWISQGKE